jgi:hypothetical protein
MAFLTRPSNGHYFFGARGTKLSSAVIVCAGAGFLLLGYDQGVLSGVIGNTDFLDTLDHPSSSVVGTLCRPMGFDELIV